jgi:hypothetical protein
MRLANDYIHPTPRGDRCRVRIYLPEEEQDAPVVVCSELPNNEGSSVTYSAHQVAAEVIRYHEQPVVPVWIGNYLKEATEGNSAGLELVAFSSYTIRERAPLPREASMTVGEPTWNSLDRERVEVLLADEVWTNRRCGERRAVV